VVPKPDRPIPCPLPGDVHPGRRFSLCGEALAPFLDELSEQAEAAGWTSREVAVATLTWAAGRAAAIDGPEAAGEALMLALDLTRMREPGA
jgi:hypothetical protein